MSQKAPGKSYRTGLTLVELMDMFPTEEAAREWIESERWPGGPFCPHCGSMNVQSNIKHKTMTHRCRDCPDRPMFSLRTGTVMQSSKLGYRIWAIGAYLVLTSLTGVSSMKLHRDLGITQKSAWHLAHRLRKALEWNHDPFSGPVEIDETYIGGKEKNKHESKKLRAGRGPVGKIPVVGIKDRDTNRIVATPMETVSQENVEPLIQSMVSLDAMIYTDSSSAYDRLENHESVNHSVGEYVREQAHTNGIESFWSMLKRGYQGTYYKMSEKHLWRYVDEFTGRHNIRDLDTLDQMRWLVHAMFGRQLRYRSLVGREE